MMRPSNDPTELRGLLDALCEETITAEQLRRLEEILLSRPEAEAYYVQYVSQFADLVRRFAPAGQPRDHAPTEARPKTTRTAPARPARGRRRTWLLLAGAVGLAGLAAALLLALLPPRHREQIAQPPNREAVDNSVAVLLQAHEAEWENTELPTRVGAALPPGWLRLKSGVAQLEFYSGATVILQGPAELQLISRTEAYCARGKLRATVPPQAQGFTIGTPKLDLVDRGTEFGVQVGADDKTEVHVFKGKVELYDGPREKTARPTELTTGTGVRLDGPGQLSSIPTNPTAFQTAEGLAKLSKAETRRRQREWRTVSETLRRDKSLVVYYTFETEHQWSRTLPDLAPARQPSEGGAIVGCAWASGRWPGKGALEFKRVSDRVRFHVPGEFDSLTLVAWVRIDSLPNLNDSLMMADGWNEGAPHWQLRDDGTLILGVQSHPKGKGAHYHAEGAITPDLFGQWLQLAVVYDADAGQVTHFVNGRIVAEVPIQFDIPLRIGDAELGNWNLAAHHNKSPVRYFNGSMDEFLLFSRALDADQIAQLYAEGRPPG